MAPDSREFLHRLLEGGEVLALFAEDLEEFIPESLALALFGGGVLPLALFGGEVLPLAGEGDGAVGDFIP